MHMMYIHKLIKVNHYAYHFDKSISREGGGNGMETRGGING